MLAYKNTKYTRGEIIKRTQWHREQDHLKPRIGWEVAGNSVRGCMIGCILESYDHRKFPEHIGHPEVLAHLADSIFEGLHETDQPELANAFPGDYLESAREGADLSMVWPKWCLWMMDGLPKSKKPEVVEGVDSVKVLYAEWAATGIMPNIERFDEKATALREVVRDAAADAAVWAAWAAWTDAVAAADAAWAAARARAVAPAARAATGWTAAAFWRDAREELLRLMREC